MATGGEMFQELKKICSRPEAFSAYTAEKLWNDSHISGKMLAFHLDPDSGLASRTEQFINSSADWIDKRFGLAGKKIIDFGCGPGLYTGRFAGKGAFVTGVDFSERSIEYARKTAAGKNLEINYIFQNYLDFETHEKFDLATMIFCDFCALSPAQRKVMLRKFRDILKDGGSLFLDVITVSAFDRKTESSSFGWKLMDGFWVEGDYYGFMNVFKYPAEKVSLDKYTIFEKDRNWEVFNWLQYFSCESLSKELEENGFKIKELFSDAAGKPFSKDSAEMAVIAEKKK